jgi:Helix-turn-helix.
MLRDQAGLTAEEVGDHLGCHNSKVSRIETGKRACTARDLNQLMDLYEVSGDMRTKLTGLAQKGRQRIQPWWQTYGDAVSANYAEFMSYEAEATNCWEYQPVLIPAQLQTEDYARAVTEVGFAALSPDQVDILVEVRMRRQHRVQEDDMMQVNCLISEAALHFRVGGDAVMRAQLEHLTEIAKSPEISLQVIPFAAGEAGTCQGAFTLFSAGQDVEADAAFIESAEGSTFKDDPLTLRRLKRLYHSLSQASLSADDTIELITKELTSYE